MKYNYTLLIILAIIGSFLYVRHRNKLLREMKIEDKYLSKSEDIKKILQRKLRKPILWIHIDYKYNAMNWSSFFSRSNSNMNTPYINMTVESIINSCSESFNICVINDSSFEQLLPNWNTDLSRIGDPLKEKIRYFGMISLIQEYGGLLVPSSFLCLKDLESLYRICCQTQKPVVFENSDRTPNPLFIGSNSQNETLGEYLQYLERNLSRDYTDESCFLRDDRKWLNRRVQNDTIKNVHGEIIGTITSDGNPVDVQDIVSINKINFESCENLHGILIPHKELRKRTQLNWFCYLSEADILKSKLCIANYFNKY